MSKRNAWQELTGIKVREMGEGYCEYSAAHTHKGIKATVAIDCGPVGKVPACGKCAALFAKLGG